TLNSFPTRRSSDLYQGRVEMPASGVLRRCRNAEGSFLKSPNRGVQQAIDSSRMPDRRTRMLLRGGRVPDIECRGRNTLLRWPDLVRSSSSPGRDKNAASPERALHRGPFHSEG